MYQKTTGLPAIATFRAATAKGPPTPASVPAPVTAKPPAAKRKTPIEGNLGRDDGIVKVLNWPHRLNKIQRRDGRAFTQDPQTGKRVRAYRSDTTYSKEWLTEQTKRKEDKNNDPLYDFYRIVAGLSRTSLEDEVIEGGGGGGGGGRGGNNRAGVIQSAASSPFSNARDIADRAIDMAKNKMIPAQLLITALGENQPKELKQDDLLRISFLEKATDLIVFLSLVDFKRVHEQPSREDVEAIEALRSSHTPGNSNGEQLRTLDPGNIDEWLGRLAWDPAREPLPVDVEIEADIALLTNDNLMQPGVNKGINKEAYQKAFAEIEKRSYYPYFVKHQALRRFFYNYERKALNEELETFRLDRNPETMSLRQFNQKEALLDRYYTEARDRWANITIAMTRKYPEEYFADNQAYAKLQELLTKNASLQDILLWDSTYNKGKIRKDLERAQTEDSEREAAGGEGGREWVGLPENLGFVLPRDIFHAAVQSAFQDVQDVCGKQNIPLIDLQTHQRVRVDFARLCAQNVKLVRADNPTRNESEKRVQRIEKSIYLIKQKFKKLTRSAIDGFLIFRGIQDEIAYAERDVANVNRLFYQEATKEYKSDIYNVQHMLGRGVAQNGFLSSLVLPPSGKISLDEAMLSANGRFPWEVARQPGVVLTGAMQKRLAEDEELFSL